MKNSESQNIEIRNVNVEMIFVYSKLCIQNRVFLYSVKTSFDIDNMISGNTPNAKVGF